MRAWAAILIGGVLTACGSTPTTVGLADAGADAPASDDAATADAAQCADLKGRMDAALVKTCTTADDCAVVTVSGCCEVYTGIRKDHQADYEAARQTYSTACPEPGRGCGCQDHTETGDPVPATQPPVVVIASCDTGQCTAHVRK